MKWYKLFNGSVPQKKQDPLTALAIGSSIVGGIGNLIGTSNANATQMAIAKKQMEWQTQENQKNRDYQTEMWERQNEYNTPSNQRKLLQDAGYNPFVLQQNGTTSGAGSAGTPSMVGAPNMPHIQPVNPLQGVSSFMDALSLSMQNKQADSNVALQKSEIIQNMAKFMIESYDKLGPKASQDLWKHFEPALSSISFEGSRSDIMFQNYLKDELSQRYNLDSQSMLNDLHYDLEKKFTPQQIQANLERIQYDISEVVARLNSMQISNQALIDRTASEVVRNLAHSFALKHEGEKFKADAKTANDMRKWLLDTVEYESKIKGIQYLFSYVDAEENSDLFGFRTSKEGKARKSKQYRITSEQRSSDIIRAFDKVFGEYISVTGSYTPHSPTYNRTNNSIFPSVYSTNYYPFGTGQ